MRTKLQTSICASQIVYVADGDSIFIFSVIGDVVSERLRVFCSAVIAKLCRKSKFTLEQ